MSLSRVKAVLLMSIVFLLGAIAGASLGTTVVSRKFASTPEISRKQGREKFIEKLDLRLHLLPPQREKLQLILDETHQQFGQLHQSVKPQFEAIRNQMRDRIREQLDAPQRQEFEVLIQEYDKCRAQKNRR
jgi:hypothetical protein